MTFQPRLHRGDIRRRGTETLAEFSGAQPVMEAVGGRVVQRRDEPFDLLLLLGGAAQLQFEMLKRHRRIDDTEIVRRVGL